MLNEAVILADGSFPVHAVPLEYLRNARHIVCCDGSVRNLVMTGLEPEAIVGDLDSLDQEMSDRFADRLFKDPDQETNDLTKAVKWCSGRGFQRIVIVGATGKREDHTIGNISLLAEYSKDIEVIMVTDTGIIIPLNKSGSIQSFPGQQISVFSIDPETEISSSGLKYQLNNLKSYNWWRATLNEATGESVSLKFSGGPLIIYMKFADQ
jgi:thiamine pyrophosphokinase